MASGRMTDDPYKVVKAGDTANEIEVVWNSMAAIGYEFVQAITTPFLGPQPISYSGEAVPDLVIRKVLAMRKCVWIACLSALSGCAIGGIDQYPTADVCFQATFNHSPGLGIRNLQCEGKSFRDSDFAYLRFTASLTEFKRLMHGIPSVSRGQFESAQHGFGPVPSWWKPLDGSPMVFLQSENYKKEFQVSCAYVTYDPSTQVVCMYWDASS